MLQVALLSFALAPLWLLLEQGMSAAGVPLAATVQAGPKLEQTIRAWVGSGSTHALQFLLWWVYATAGEDWIYRPSEYVASLSPTDPEAMRERRRVVPFYVLYLAYVWHSTFKDLRRNWNKMNNPAQIMFLVHHLLTIFLVNVSLETGYYRIGALTRLLHDPADIVLYFSKIYNALYDNAPQLFSRRVLSVLYVILSLVWCTTRVIGHGFLNYYSGMMILAHTPEWEKAHPSLASQGWMLLAGNSAMWLLQVIWMLHLGDKAVKFITKGVVEADAIDRGQLGAEGKAGKEAKGKDFVDALMTAATEPAAKKAQ